MTINEAQITQLEKRARGFRRIISALNDLPMYGINSLIDKVLYIRIGELKEHLKKKITRNNEKLNELHTTSIDSLREYDELKTDQRFIKDKSLIAIIDKVEELIRALRKSIIREK